MKKIAVYNGSFDPVTNGHLDIIERAAKIFDILYVTVAIHPTKVGLFTIEQRKELLKKATSHLKNVIVDSTDELFMTLLCGSKEGPLQSGSVAAKMGLLFIIDVLFNEYCRTNPALTEANREATAGAISAKLL